MVATAISGAAPFVIPNGRHHVEIATDERFDELGRPRRIVCRVAIDEHVNVGIDFSEHSAHDAALAGPLLPPHDCARRARVLSGSVGRSIVVNIDNAIRQCGKKFPHDLRHGGRLVAARDENGDASVHGRAMRQRDVEVRRLCSALQAETAYPEIAYATKPANSTIGGCNDKSTTNITTKKITTNGTLFFRLNALKLQYLKLLTIVRPANTVRSHAHQRSGSGS